MKRLFSEPEPQADLTHGVPGVQWHGSETPPESPPPLPGAGARLDGHAESFAVYLGIVAAVALFLRLIIVGMGPATNIEAAYTPATAVELQLAEGLANELRYGVTEYPEGSRYAAVEAVRAERGERQTLADSERYPDAYHAPGYPAVLAAFVKIGLDLRWLLVLQCLIAVGTTLVAYQVTLALIGLRAPALLVATLTALHPALVVAPAALSGGVIATALLMLGLWALSDRDDSEPLIATAGGLSLGLSSLFNPLLLWSAPLVAVWLILSGRRLQSVVITAAVILGAAGPPALWMYRNASVGLGPTLTRAPDLERYMGVLSELESPALPSSTREAAILEELKAPPLAPDAANTSLFAQMDGEARWRLREQGNAYLQLGNNRALRTLVAHSADTAFTRLKIAYTPDGNTAAWLGETAGPATPNTPGTSTLASGWLMLNFLLLAATIAGAVALLWRRHLHEAGLLLGLGVVIVLGSITLPGESERLPVFILQMVLIGGVLSPQPVRVAREQRGARRSGGLNLQRLGGAAPGVSLAPLTPLGSAQAPPKPAGTGQNDIHPILRSHTPELNDNPPSPGRLV